MITILSFALAMLVTSVAVPLCSRVAPALGLIDAPSNARKVHNTATPHSGGVAIVLGVAVAAGVWVPWTSSYIPLVLALAIIFGFALADDMVDLGYRYKLLGQILASSLVIGAYGGFNQLPFFALDTAPVWLTFAFSLVFLVGITNAVNLSDGLDGLAAGNGMLSFAVLAVFAAQIDEVGYMAMSLAVVGGIVGFLRFNTHPASIFMGDSGSQFIGFMGGALGLPVLDTFTVMGIRKFRGRPIFAADRSHLHHQLLRLEFRHSEVVLLLYALQSLCVGLAFQFRFSADSTVLLVYLAFCALVLGVIGALRISGWQAHKICETGKTERRNLLLRKFSWYHTNTARVISCLLACAFLYSAWRADPAGQSLSNSLIAAATLVLVSLILFPKHLTALSRISCYLVSFVAVYSGLLSNGAAKFTLAQDLFICGLTLALVLAISITRRRTLKFNSQDYLVLLVVGVTPFLLPANIEPILALRIVVYLAILLYSSEYVITRGKHSRWLIAVAGGLTMALTAV